MKRVLVGMLASVLALGLAVSDAQSREEEEGRREESRSRRATKHQDRGVDDRPQMGHEQGRAHEQAHRQGEREVPAAASPRPDAVEEDRLRQRPSRRSKRIRKGYVEFDGRSTGWNVSFLKGEFTHSNDESMSSCATRTRRTSTSSSMASCGSGTRPSTPRCSRRQFRRRSGRGRAPVRQGQGRKGELVGRGRAAMARVAGQVHAPARRRSERVLRLLLPGVRGEADRRQARAAALEHGEKGDKRHAMVESVTAERSDEPDDSPNIVDRITGKLRQSEQAPAAADDGERAGSAGKCKAKGRSRAGREPGGVERRPNLRPRPLSAARLDA